MEDLDDQFRKIREKLDASRLRLKQIKNKLEAIQLRSQSPEVLKVSHPNQDIPNFAFITCIESGILEDQALLLYESIRLYGGRFRNCPIYALSPREGFSVSTETQKKLERLSVNYIDKVLNKDYAFFPFSNKSLAAAYIEETKNHDFLCFLDRDTLFLQEPVEFLAMNDMDCGVRPVDLKGVCTNGSVGDEFDSYWHRLCEYCGIKYEKIPLIKTSVSQELIKANYNGGLTIVRANKGIFCQWRDNLNRAIEHDVKPFKNNSKKIGCSVGLLEPKAAQFWGSGQTTLSVAIWRLTEKVKLFSNTYNYPLHLEDRMLSCQRPSDFNQLVHIHYHWMFNLNFFEKNSLTSKHSNLDLNKKQWLISKIPIDLKTKAESAEF